MLKLWKDHFFKMLAENSANDNGKDIPLIHDDEISIPHPSYIEVETAIQRLINNKAPGAHGLPAELYKTVGNELVRSMHQLICKIWLTECMPADWNLSQKKGDATLPKNYRGISLLPVAYKVFTSVLCERQKPLAEEIVGLINAGLDLVGLNFHTAPNPGEDIREPNRNIPLLCRLQGCCFQ